MEKGNKKVINGWAFYDWANSVYPLVISNAIFPIYFNEVTSEKVNFFGRIFVNTELYTYVVALSFIIVILVSPILSGIADYSGNKKGFLQFFCYLGAASCASLYFFDGNHLEWGMFSVLLASIGFWNSLVFYNAYLPEIAHPKNHDKISAKGFSMGYFGSALLLIISLVWIMVLERSAAETFIMVGLWWAGFSQLTYSRLPPSKIPKEVKNQPRKKRKMWLKNGFNELRHVFKYVIKTKRLKRYLASFFVFSMGVQTVMLMAAHFAKKEITDMPDSGLIISILIIQFVAIGGSYLFSYISSLIGNIKTLGVGLVIWILACWTAYLIHTPVAFYGLAALVGLVMGGTQALSRSTYAKFLPESDDNTSFFSFYDITEKVGIVIGMVAFGLLEGLYGNMRVSVVALFIFFVIGLILLFFVPRYEKNKIPNFDPK